MNKTSFKAILSTDSDNKDFNLLEYRDIQFTSLADKGVLIKVDYSSLNYKDALSAKGHKGITRQYPHIPGVDASGSVESSDSDSFKPGDNVLVTGHDMGMNTWGGFSEFIRVPSEWVIPLPEGLSTKEAMMLGTGGITSAICVHEIIKSGITPESGPILVTGATGAVGTSSIAILAKLGYKVIASSGKKEKWDYLKSIGASEVLSREEVDDRSNKPLLKRRWKAAIDTVGGNTLSTVIRSTDHHGAICVLGLVSSQYFDMNVFPFLQRGVRVIGIDSAERGYDIKKELWNKLSNEWKPKNLSAIATEVQLCDIIPEIHKILEGKQVGKILINCK
jgi:putative YhdH/YhfP family quinone oxidoreductase